MHLRKRMRFLTAALLVPFLITAAYSAEPAIASRVSHAGYVWRTSPVGSSAELVTLFCQGCEQAGAAGSDVPLIALLRDTLGDTKPESSRITDLWLLSYARPNIGKRMLSAVPFFYWRVGGSRGNHGVKTLAPLLDMNALQHPAANTLTQNLLQWTVLDPLSTPVRASTRAYRGNAADDERLHLQEAISYLQQAPVSTPDSPLNQLQVQTLIARLELRKSLLGGFVSADGAAKYGVSAQIRDLEIRSRDWELLREWADKTGLYFEPLDLAGTRNEYAALWIPLTGSHPASATSVAPIWKLLNLKPPSPRDLQQIPAGAVFERALDENGNLLPAGSSGARQIKLVPLGIYSLDYPKMPLLVADFRNHHHLRWRAMEQRSINEVTAGVIGISHFTNWYYYVAADLYDFVASRHGSPMNQAARLDCYSQFRARLALDRELDPTLRAEAMQRIDSLAMNPLEAAPNAEMQAASANFKALEDRAQTGQLLALVKKNRREELAAWDRTKLGAIRHELFRVLTFGAYTPEAKSSEDIVAQLAVQRRAQYQLDFLEQLARAGTPPEVQVDSNRIAASVAELESLLPAVNSDRFHLEARNTIARLRSNSEDSDLQARCERALVALYSIDEARRTVALKPTSVRLPSAE